MYIMYMYICMYVYIYICIFIRRRDYRIYNGTLLALEVSVGRTRAARGGKYERLESEIARDLYPPFRERAVREDRVVLDQRVFFSLSFTPSCWRTSVESRESAPRTSRKRRDRSESP